MSEQLTALTNFCVNNNELDQLEAMLAEFNLFEAAGLTSQEIRHSRFLSFLLDPRGAHGLGDRFVTRLLQAAVHGRPPDEVGVTTLDLELMDLSDLQVTCEFEHIDILLLSAANKFAVVIENKIGTGEHSNQLSRYLRVVNTMKPGWRILPVLLSPVGMEASDPRYFAVSYENVAESLHFLIGNHRASLGSDVLTALTHYVNLLRRHVVTDSKLTELCQQIISKHRKALELLMEHMDTPKSVARSIVEGMLEESGWTRSGQYRYPKDWLETVPAGADGLPIVSFWLDYSLKLSLVMEIQPGQVEVRQQLLDAAVSQPSIFIPARKTLGTKYNRILRVDLASTSSPSEANVEEWESQVRAGFKKFCEEILPQAGSVLKSASMKPNQS
jgi:hypothetical protein